MKIITLNSNDTKNAGPKAPADINFILQKKYNATIINIERRFGYKFKLLFNAFISFFSKDIVIIQYPVVYKKIFYSFFNKKKSIILIHDINGIRSNNDELLKKEIKILKLFNYIIVHNDVMKKTIVSLGIDETKVYVLNIFDYIANGNINIDKSLKSNINVMYAGNLKKSKCPFIYQLDPLKMQFNLYLYGLGISSNINEKIIYKGSFESNEINTLEGDLGLIWDGNYNESDEKESFKNYTKYNNPHKLSCYLACGIPVIVWSKAATASFVKKNNIGYCISNIYEINDLDLSDYNLKKKNAIEIGKKLRNGDYTCTVINSIIEDMEKNK